MEWYEVTIPLEYREIVRARDAAGAANQAIRRLSRQARSGKIRDFVKEAEVKEAYPKEEDGL